MIIDNYNTVAYLETSNDLVFDDFLPCHLHPLLKFPFDCRTTRTSESITIPGKYDYVSQYHWSMHKYVLVNLMFLRYLSNMTLFQNVLQKMKYQAVLIEVIHQLDSNIFSSI